MARAQIGNDPGVAARDAVSETLLGAVTADAASAFAVSAVDARKFRVGQVIDIVVRASGATGAGALGRTVTYVAAAEIGYSGGDLTLDTTYGAYLTGTWELASPVASGNRTPNDPYANLNGGPSVASGFDSNVYGSIDSMRTRLQAISATTYSNAELDKMTYNDMVYAIRVNEAPGTI